MRMLIITFMCLFGGIFALVGLSQYLETLPTFTTGMGFIIVGAGVFLLALFALAMQKE
jgi:hypothetical protein